MIFFISLPKRFFIEVYGIQMATIQEIKNLTLGHFLSCWSSGTIGITFLKWSLIFQFVLQYKLDSQLLVSDDCFLSVEAHIMYTANKFGLRYSRKRISQNSIPNFIYIFPKSFMIFCQELLDPKRNYENQIWT